MSSLTILYLTQRPIMTSTQKSVGKHHRNLIHKSYQLHGRSWKCTVGLTTLTLTTLTLTTLSYPNQYPINLQELTLTWHHDHLRTARWQIRRGDRTTSKITRSDKSNNGNTTPSYPPSTNDVKRAGTILTPLTFKTQTWNMGLHSV